MALTSKFIVISLSVTLFYFIGLLSFITDYDENKCEMTYMFEYPQFVKIKVAIEEQLPRYGLYAYSEGKLTERARAMKFDGIPVLFVPGNAGSYKQVRSLASVALRKALYSRVGYHFDFFTLDLNDEFSGLNGAVLDDQTQFLNYSLHRILDLYDRKKSSVPKSVIIIGHSMGGVISHNLLGNSKTADNVDLLITFASPHRRPIISLDSYIAKYYDQIAHNNNSLQNKTLVTIGGGFHDHLVHSWLTHSNFSSLNLISTTIPTVGLSLDHACVMWCKQFVITINRALFDSIDLKTKQLSIDESYRKAVFKHHLITNSGINIRWGDRYKVISRFDHRGEWHEDLRRQYTMAFPRGTQDNQWLMVRIVDDPKHEALFVQAVNLAVTDWIFACTADSIRGHSRYCENGIHLSHLSKIAPTSRFKRRTQYVNLVRLKKRYPEVTHVVIRILPTPEAMSINFDIHNSLDRIITLALPRWFSLSRTSVIARSARDSLRYEIHLTGLQHIIQAYLLYIEPVDCSAETHHATITLSVPWANHDSHIFITENLRKPLPIRLHNSRPTQRSNVTAKIYLTLDPNCQYTISIRNSFIGMLGQFARFYSPLLIANIAAVILMSYRSQLISLDENGYCSLFQSSLSMSTKPYYLITSAKLISKILSMFRFPSIIPVPDTQIIIDENIDFLILPLLLYLISVGLTYLLTVCLWIGITMSESTVNKILSKFFMRTIGGTFKMSDWFVNALHRVPCVVATTLVFLGLTTCGGLALCLGVAYYFLKLTQLCHDYLENLVYGYAKNMVFKLVRKIFPKNNTAKTSEVIKENTNEISNRTDSNEIKNNSTDEKNVLSVNTWKDSLQSSDTEEIEKDNEINSLRLICLKSSLSKKKTSETRTPVNNQVTSSNINEPATSDTNFDNSKMHFHFTLFLLWFIVAGLNTPSVLTWAHNFQYSNVLSPDPSFFFGVVLCVCAIPMWQLELPKCNKLYYKHISMFVYAMAMLCLIYAPLNLYRLSYILTATIVVTILHQLFAPDQTDDETDSDEDQSVDPIALLKDIKHKLE